MTIRKFIIQYMAYIIFLLDDCSVLAVSNLHHLSVPESPFSNSEFHMAVFHLVPPSYLSLKIRISQFIVKTFPHCLGFMEPTASQAYTSAISLSSYHIAYVLVQQMLGQVNFSIIILLFLYPTLLPSNS